MIGVTIGYLEPVSGNLLESPRRHLEKTAECVVNEIEIQPSYLGFEFERVMGGWRHLQNKNGEVIGKRIRS